MNNELPIAIRGILSTAILLLVAVLLNTTPVQSAFPNAPLADPNLTLTKTVINDNGGTATQVNFQAKIDGGDVNWDEANPVSADVVHTASETALVPGYSPSVWGGNCAADGTITLAADTSGTCSITNNDIPPTLTLAKIVNNNYGGVAVITDWTLTATGPTTISGAGGASSDPSFDAGVYTLSESAGPSGYTSGPWVCTGGSQAGDQITIALGEIVSCSITSSDVQPQLTVIKDVVNDNGGALGSGDFTINVTGTNVSISSFPGAVSPGTTVTLNAGSYNVAETPATGYASSYSPDCTGTIAVGEIKTCTITNNDISPSLTVIKNVVNNGGTLIPSDFTITVSGTNVSQTSFPGAVTPGTTVTLDSGSYNVSEIPIFGYSPGYSGDCSGTIAIGESKTCTVTNTNIPAIKVDPNSGLETEENGNKETLNVVLTTIPTGSVSITITSSKPLEGTVDPNVINFNSTNWNIPKKVEVIGVDDEVVDGDIGYQVTLDPKSSIAAEYQGLKVILPVTNLDAPTIEWVNPVGNGQVYIIDNLNPILLKVRNPGDELISKVRFYRWVPSANDWVTIGEDLYPPYQQTIYPSELELGWNEIRAFAWGPPGEDQRFSSHEFIFILNGDTVFLPIMMR